MILTITTGKIIRRDNKSKQLSPIESNRSALKEISLSSLQKTPGRNEAQNLRSKLIAVMGNDLFKQMYDFLSKKRACHTPETEVE